MAILDRDVMTSHSLGNYAAIGSAPAEGGKGRAVTAQFAKNLETTLLQARKFGLSAQPEIKTAPVTA